MDGVLSLQPLPDQAAAFLALYAAAEADAVVKDEAPENVGPGGVIWEIGVELAGDVVELVEAGPGDGREVMVLVVQADVVGQEVEGPVVRIRLGDGDAVRGVGLRGRYGRIDVVLRDEVAGERMQAACQEGGQQEVQHGLGPERAQNYSVEEDLCGDVEGRYPGEGNAVDGHGPQGVEEDLEGAEECLAQDGVEEYGLECGRQVRIEPVNAQGLVMGQVVRSEGSAIRDTDGQVRKDGEDAIGRWRAEGEVVAYLMYGEEEVLVRRCADDVGENPEIGGEEGRVADEGGAGYLDRDDEENDVLRQGLWTAELRYLDSSLMCKLMLDGRS